MLGVLAHRSLVKLAESPATMGPLSLLSTTDDPTKTLLLWLRIASRTTYLSYKQASVASRVEYVFKHRRLRRTGKAVELV